jgi:hypothetical protein
MNKLYALIILTGFHFPIFSQSFIKGSINVTRFNNELSQQSIGIGGSIGHQLVIGKNSFVKFITGQSLELKRAPFSYFSGGLGGSSTTTGTINFANLKLDTRARIQGNFFADLGIFAALAVHKYITNGKDIISARCNPFPNPVCFPSTEGPATDHFKHFSLSLDAQLGFYKVVDLRYDNYNSNQINLSLELPISYLKFH